VVAVAEQCEEVAQHARPPARPTIAPFCRGRVACTSIGTVAMAAGGEYRRGGGWVGGGVGVVGVAAGVAYGFEVLLGELEECAGGVVWIVGDVVRDGLC